MTKTETIKGFRDIEDASKRIAIQRQLEDIFRLYGFQAVETPVIEYEEFVAGGNSNDEAVSSIFKLKDRGERKLALRYEFTFQLKRIAKNKKLPFKRYQIGPVFRDEPVSSARFRQFTQCDIDTIGSTIEDEAEILKIASKILDKLGIKFTILLNNRKLLNEILNELEVEEADKEQVIRELDKLDKLPKKSVKENLKPFGAEKAIDVLTGPENAFVKYPAYGEIKALLKICKDYGIRNITFQPSLARGLSYYDGTIFEIKSDIKESIAAGGAYLVGGFKSFGMAFGLDRLEILTKKDFKEDKVLILSIEQDKKAIELADKLREDNISCAISKVKISKALDYANSYHYNRVIFLGEQEVKSKKYKLKDMDSGKEKLVSELSLIKELK